MDEKDIGGIIADLEERNYRGSYYIQNFRADNGRPTLKALPLQSRTLDIASLPHPRNFRLSFRNFDPEPAAG
jgi:hypothetical protein